ncbi:hypothetical protein NHX12_008786 [Muraenolepis orangiensis]|uniref:Uncharacterized protein n=1 Tax=Muraenolepis orangiensis TaxID=630683 RepID=A0A9Q0DNR9_9TELE|nr:hypothetical protein NHX12_008786 [Muraenolepis orangiensis]
MLQQNNNNNYPCLNMTGPTGGEALQACPRAPVPFPSRMELSLGDIPLVRGLRAWALCSKNRLKTRGELETGGQAPTVRPTTTTTTTHGRLTSCPRPADMGSSRGMGYGLPIGLDARQAGLGALVTVATLKTSEVGGKTQTQCLFLRTEKGSCLYSTTKPGGWSLGKGPGLTASGASALVGSWLRGKVSGGVGGGVGHQAGKQTSAPPLPTAPPALQSGGSNRVRVRSGRRWRKSCNAGGPGQNKTTGLGGQRRGRGEAAAEVILGERQEGRNKREYQDNLPGGKEGPGALSDQTGGGCKQEGGAGTNRSCRCCQNTLAQNCVRCARRAGRPGAQHGLEEYKSQGEGERALNGPDNKDEGLTKGEQEKRKEETEREEKSRSKSLDSIVFVPNADSQTNCFYPESFSNSEASEKSHDKDIREINEPLQTKMSAYSENKEEPCSQNSKTDDVSQARVPHNLGCEELTNGLGTPGKNDLRHSAQYLDDSLPPTDGPSSPPLVVRNPPQKHCEDVRLDANEFPAVADTEPRQDSKSSRQPLGGEGNSLCSVKSAMETAVCCEEGLHCLTSARPVEGSTFPVDLSVNLIQGPQASSTAGDGKHNSSHTESAEQCKTEKADNGDSEGGLYELRVKSDNQLMPQESPFGALYTKGPFHEKEPLEQAGNVNCSKAEVVLSEEGRGSCKQATCSWRNEGKAHKDEVEYAATAPGLREVDRLRGESILKAVGGISTNADEEVEEAEEYNRPRNEGDCSEIEFKEGRGDELAEEHGGAESGLESAGDGQTRAPELRADDSSREIRGEKKKKKKHDRSLPDGSAETMDDGKHGNLEAKFAEGEAAQGWRRSRGDEERREAQEVSSFTAEGWPLQEFSTEWTQEANCALPLSPPPLEEGEDEEDEEETRRREGGQNPVENAETCCPLSLIPSIATGATSSPLPDPRCRAHAAANPVPPPPPPLPGAMATDPQCPGANGGSRSLESRVDVASKKGIRVAKEEEEVEEKEEEGEVATVSDSPQEPGGQEEEEEEEGTLEEKRQKQSATVASERKEQGEEEVDRETQKEEQEDEFGSFMQADAEPSCSEGCAPSAPVACENTENTTGEY